MSDLELPQIAACLQPISAAAPTGQDARLEPQHEQVRAEIAKLSALADSAPDWGRVASLGLGLLRSHSKDLLIASYVAEALSELHGAAGVQAGLGLVADLLETFGDTLFPMRGRARVNALEWLLDRCQARFAQLSVPRAQVRALEHQAAQLRDAACALCGPDAPSFAELFRALERMSLSAPAEATPVPASPSAAAAVAPSAPPDGFAGPSAAGTPERRTAPERASSPERPGVLAHASALPSERAPGRVIGSDGEEPLSTPTVPSVVPTAAGGALAFRTGDELAQPPGPRHATPIAPRSANSSGIEASEVVHAFGAPPEQPAKVQAYVFKAGMVMIDLARSRFAADRSDPRAYRWLRTGLWLGWERAPAANRRGRSDIDPPPPKLRAELAKLTEAESWDDALAGSEAMLADHPLWLDPHAITCRALERLGERFAPARAAVERESRAFMARLPELLALQFADGTPFGSAETVAWLKPQAGCAADGETTDGSELCADIARGERAAGERFEKVLRACGSKRAAFRLRVELTRALNAAGKTEQALHLCAGLEQELDAHRLELWEPELAVVALKTLWQVWSAARTNGRAQAEAARVGARLAQLAPTALL